MHNNLGVLDLTIRKLAVVSFDEIFSTVFTVCLFILSWKKHTKISIIKVVFTISLFKKSPFPQYCLSRVMAIHTVIKVGIKQTKMIFFCLHFNPVFSRNSLTTHVLQKYPWRNWTCTSYLGDVTFCLCQTSVNSKYFRHSLGLWDSEVDLYFQNYSKLHLIFSWFFSMLSKNRKWCHDLKIAYGVKG